MEGAKTECNIGPTLRGSGLFDPSMDWQAQLVRSRSHPSKKAVSGDSARKKTRKSTSKVKMGCITCKVSNVINGRTLPDTCRLKNRGSNYQRVKHVWSGNQYNPSVPLLPWTLSV